MKQPEWASFEKRIADAVGGEVVHRSGAGRWAKMDAKGVRLLISCKHTEHGTRTIAPVEFDEVERAVRAPGGVGGDTLPAMGIGIRDDDFILMRAADFAELAVKRERVSVPMDRSEERRSDSRDTPLMRQIMEEG